MSVQYVEQRHRPGMFLGRHTAADLAADVRALLAAKGV